MFIIIPVIEIFLLLINAEIVSITESTLIVSGAYMAYYAVMEILFQKTFGTFVTKTKVVNNNGEKPSRLDIIIRTFCRLIPFDQLSFLFFKNGLHDVLSKTKVVQDHMQ